MARYKILTKNSLKSILDKVKTGVYSDITDATKTLRFNEINSIKSNIANEITLTINKFITLDGKKKDYTSKQLVQEVSIEASSTLYEVTFDSNGGSYVTSQNISYGEKATKPVDPTKNGYDFAGWYLNESPYNFNTPITEDITLVAHWDEVSVETYEVTLRNRESQSVEVKVDGSNYTIINTETIEISGNTARFSWVSSDPDGYAWLIDGQNTGSKTLYAGNTYDLTLEEVDQPEPEPGDLIITVDPDIQIQLNNGDCVMDPLYAPSESLFTVTKDDEVYTDVTISISAKTSGGHNVAWVVTAKDKNSDATGSLSVPICDYTELVFNDRGASSICGYTITSHDVNPASPSLPFVGQSFTVTIDFSDVDCNYSVAEVAVSGDGISSETATGDVGSDKTATVSWSGVAAGKTITFTTDTSNNDGTSCEVTGIAYYMDDNKEVTLDTKTKMVNGSTASTYFSFDTQYKVGNDIYIPENGYAISSDVSCSNPESKKLYVKQNCCDSDLTVDYMYNGKAVITKTIDACDAHRTGKLGVIYPSIFLSNYSVDFSDTSWRDIEITCSDTSCEVPVTLDDKCSYDRNSVKVYSGLINSWSDVGNISYGSDPEEQNVNFYVYYTIDKVCDVGGTTTETKNDYTLHFTSSSSTAVSGYIMIPGSSTKYEFTIDNE